MSTETSFVKISQNQIKLTPKERKSVHFFSASVVIRTCTWPELGNQNDGNRKNDKNDKRKSERKCKAPSDLEVFSEYGFSLKMSFLLFEPKCIQMAVL
jgi:hypothetical protein